MDKDKFFAMIEAMSKSSEQVAQKRDAEASLVRQTREWLARNVRFALASVLAFAYVQPLETKLRKGRSAVRDGDGTADAWFEVADVYDALAFPKAARMFRNVGDAMLREGKRFKLTYPDGDEHIVEVS